MKFNEYFISLNCFRCFINSDKEEDDEVKKRITEVRLKMSKKLALIAKTSPLLDFKCWDNETDMNAMVEYVKIMFN